MDRNPKACSGPIHIDAHVLIGSQPRMPDAVPDKLRYEQPRIMQKFGRDRERRQGPSHCDQRFRTSEDAEIQSPSRPCYRRDLIGVHHHGLPGRRAIHTLGISRSLRELKLV